MDEASVYYNLERHEKVFNQERGTWFKNGSEEH